MQFRRLEWKEDELLQKMLGHSRDQRNRPTLTDLIYCLTKTAYIEATEKEGKVYKPSRKTGLFFVLGLGLEATLLRGSEKPPVGEKDGIQYHLDDVDLDELLELKTTRMKPGNEPSLTDGWLKQVKGYLYAEGLNKINFAVLHLIQPEIRVWELEFTQEELDENWAWLLERKRIYEEFRERAAVPTPYQYNMDWECQGCDFAFYCEVLKGKV